MMLIYWDMVIWLGIRAWDKIYVYSIYIEYIIYLYRSAAAWNYTIG